MTTSRCAERPGCLTLWRLAGVIKQPFPRVWKEYSTRLAANQGYPITLPFTVTRPQVAYMLERHDRFPSIQFQRTFVRDYPALDQPAIGAINPNLIGHVGAITADNLKDPAFRGENLPRTGIGRPGGHREVLRRLAARVRRRDGADVRRVRQARCARRTSSASR